jgi:Ca2+-binding RTX toxin-like protein
MFLFMLLVTIVMALLVFAGWSTAATIQCPYDGSPGDGKCLGTNGPDTMYGNGGGNIMWGRGGNDWMIGFGGFDYLYGGPGSDTIRTHRDGSSDYLNGDIPGVRFLGWDVCHYDGVDFNGGGCDRKQVYRH